MNRSLDGRVVATRVATEGESDDGGGGDGVSDCVARRPPLGYEPASCPAWAAGLVAGSLGTGAVVRFGVRFLATPAGDVVGDWSTVPRPMIVSVGAASEGERTKRMAAGTSKNRCSRKSVTSYS